MKFVKYKDEMKVLRHQMHWSLQAIADHFGCTREWVRICIGNTGHIPGRKRCKNCRRLVMPAEWERSGGLCLDCQKQI
jgi:hypothetical protein